MRHTIVAIALGAVLAAWVVVMGREGWTPMRLAGVALLVVGYAGWLAAHLTLGRSFAIQARAQQLVTRGIYSKIRNPIYVFGALLIAGVLLLLQMPWLLLILVVIIPMQVWRARNEARVLEEKFGDDYRAYRAKTWF